MALAKVLSQCVGPGGQLVANAVIFQQLLPAAGMTGPMPCRRLTAATAAGVVLCVLSTLTPVVCNAGVRGLDVARVLFYRTAPTAEDAGAEPAAHGDQEQQRQHVTPLLAAMQNSSSGSSLSRRLNATGSSSSTGGMLLGWSTFTTTGMQQHCATMVGPWQPSHLCVIKLRCPFLACLYLEALLQTVRRVRGDHQPAAGLTLSAQHSSLIYLAWSCMVWGTRWRLGAGRGRGAGAFRNAMTRMVCVGLDPSQCNLPPKPCPAHRIQDVPCCLCCTSLLPQAAAADAGHSSSESESDADSDDKGGLLTAQEYRSKYSMWVHPPSAPAPCQTFEQAGLPPQLLKGVSGFAPWGFRRRSAGVQEGILGGL